MRSAIPHLTVALHYCLDQLRLVHCGPTRYVEPASNVKQMLLAGIGVDAFGGRDRVVQATPLGAGIRRALLFLGQPTVPDLFVAVFERRVRNAVGAFFAPVLIGGGVVRLGEGPLRFPVRALQGAGQLVSLGLTALCCLRHSSHSSALFVRAGSTRRGRGQPQIPAGWGTGWGIWSWSGYPPCLPDQPKGVGDPATRRAVRRRRNVGRLQLPSRGGVAPRVSRCGDRSTVLADPWPHRAIRLRACAPTARRRSGRRAGLAR